MLGVVLAGGRATRMPNKCLLPVDGSVPCVVQALTWLEPQCHELVVVVPHEDATISGVVAVSLSSRGLERTTIIKQRSGPGTPVTAINAVRQARPGENMFVAFGDNVYDRREKCETRDGRKVCVTTRRTRQSSLALDWYDGEKWRSRDQQPVRPAQSLAGWIFVPSTASVGPDADMLTWLTDVGAVAVQASDAHFWWDIGTPEAYADYLRYVNEVQNYVRSQCDQSS